MSDRWFTTKKQPLGVTLNILAGKAQFWEEEVTKSDCWGSANSCKKNYSTNWVFSTNLQWYTSNYVRIHKSDESSLFYMKGILFYKEGIQS